MEIFSNVSEVQKKIRDLEEQHRVATQRLERAELMKKGGAQFYHGTELPIDDAIFSLKEGQVRSVQISLEFYRHTLSTLLPDAVPAQTETPAKAVTPPTSTLAAKAPALAAAGL